MTACFWSSSSQHFYGFGAIHILVIVTLLSPMKKRACNSSWSEYVIVCYIGIDLCCDINIYMSPFYTRRSVNAVYHITIFYFLEYGQRKRCHCSVLKKPSKANVWPIEHTCFLMLNAGWHICCDVCDAHLLVPGGLRLNLFRKCIVCCTQKVIHRLMFCTSDTFVIYELCAPVMTWWNVYFLSCFCPSPRARHRVIVQTKRLLLHCLSLWHCNIVGSIDEIRFPDECVCLSEQSGVRTSRRLRMFPCPSISIRY